MKHEYYLPKDDSGKALWLHNFWLKLVTYAAALGITPAQLASVQADSVMAQVEIQCGPHRIVSLLSAEAVREMRLEPGVLAVAVIKSTNVIVETPGGLP